MLNAINMLKKDTTIQPTLIAAGPPTVKPYWNNVVIPVITLCAKYQYLEI
jgi:hypothetical protein